LSVTHSYIVANAFPKQSYPVHWVESSIFICH